MVTKRAPTPGANHARGTSTPERRLIAPEIAQLYGRALTTVQKKWMTHADWPEPTGRRGRWNTYKATDVHAFALSLLLPPEPTEGPDELLTQQEAATYLDLTESTISSYISRGTWPEPDDETDGIKRWRRSTIDAARAGFRHYHRRNG